MTKTRSISGKAQEEVLKTIRTSQEAVLDAIRTAADTVQSFTPPVAVPHLPLVGKLPKAENIVSDAYDFAEQLLAAQRKFAEDVLQAAAPLFTVQGSTAKKTGPAKAA
jgi:hypothetical protein